MGSAPNYLNCPKRGQRDHPRNGRLYRTGKTKPKPPGKMTARTSDTMRQVRCQCGHKWWSRHIEAEHLPLSLEV